MGPSRRGPRSCILGPFDHVRFGRRNEGRGAPREHHHRRGQGEHPCRHRARLAPAVGHPRSRAYPHRPTPSSSTLSNPQQLTAPTTMPGQRCSPRTRAPHWPEDHGLRRGASAAAPSAPHAPIPRGRPTPPGPERGATWWAQGAVECSESIAILGGGVVVWHQLRAADHKCGALGVTEDDGGIHLGGDRAIHLPHPLVSGGAQEQAAVGVGRGQGVLPPICGPRVAWTGRTSGGEPTTSWH